MKKVLTLLVVLAIGFTTMVSAQKTFTGTVKFHQSISGTDDPNILANAEKDFDVLVFGNYTKTVTNIQDGFGIVSITNGDAESSVTIFDIMGMGKYYVEIPADKLKERLKNIKFDYNYTGEKSTIAGYECEKVIATLTDLETDENQALTVYVSKTFNPNPAINFNEYPGLAGFPLKTEVKTDVSGTEVTIVVEAKESIPSKKIKMVDFMMPSDAQDIHTNPELMKMLGMGGDEEEDDD